MASFDLLEELSLKDYYPQKLSFSEAIKLRGGSQNGCQDQYGLDIVRKLLMFDSTAVVSVTAEINERLNNRGKKETDDEGQCVSDGARKPKTRGKRGQSKLKLHPMDLLVVVMNCCDDFLRQVLVEKMFANKLSFPILLPDVVRNGSYTLLLFALRSLVPEVQDPKRESSSSITDTLVDVKNPVVSFIRVGDLHRSKSKLVNELLNLNSFNTFFHRECRNGFAKRSVSIGSIEAAWFQSETACEGELNCRLITALNLRGDAKDYPKQTLFMCQTSTLVVFMVDSIGPFKELFENALKKLDLLQTKIIVCCISPDFIDEDECTDFQLWDDKSGHGVIFAVIYDWNDGDKMNDVDFTNDLRTKISKFFKPEHRHSSQIPTYANISQSAKNFEFLSDEDVFDYKLMKPSADEFDHLVSRQSSDCKPKILPLQGEPWKKIGKLEREQRGKSHNKSQDEHFIAEKETDKRRQREMQCRSLIQQNEIAQTFSLKFHCLKDRALSYYLNSCKIKLDARSRVMISNIKEEYEKEKQENHPQQSNEIVSEEVKLSQMELKIANSTIGLEHILREHGQMYEAIISEEIRMKEELKKNTSLTPDVIRNFPTIVARLLLMGQPLELMDGDASNVPITWVKAVLNQVRLMTDNAKVFVLSIIGVQSSGKSTLLNALFGLQFPVSAGRCTKGIYCHLVPVDKESLHTEYDYILVVDTEGLRSTEFIGKATFRDNELATFAIGLADATIINMKGENWSEMKDILQIVAYGLIRIKRTKAELELMPRCIFVHQNVSAVDAAEKNRLGQDKQFICLDTAIMAAARAEGSIDINKFTDVLKYDPDSHSWYFPDLLNGRPPKARISQDYTVKTSELRQHLMQLMDKNSKLRISSFFLRMSDLWNAMLHNDFVLCFRNTQEIILGTALNDKISRQVDGLKNVNKLEQRKIRSVICSITSIHELTAVKETILTDMCDALETNFENIKTTLRDVIDAIDICGVSRQKYESSLDEIKNDELRRIKDEIEKYIRVNMKKLENDNDRNVIKLKAEMAALEKRTEEGVNDKLNETDIKEFEKKWEQLIADNKKLAEERLAIAESEIEKVILGSMQKLTRKGELPFNISDLLKTPFVGEIPQVTENDIGENSETWSGWLTDVICSDFYVHKANNSFNVARKKWELQFESERDLEFNASHLEQIIAEVGQLLGIPKKERCVVSPGADDMGSCLPPEYRFKREYIIKFMKFVCHFTYNRSLENSRRFISMTDPLADIDERRNTSVSHYRQMTTEENINAVSKQIFEYARRSFVTDLGELIKAEVCKGDSNKSTFKTKRAFLRTIQTDLGQRTHSLGLTPVKEEKEKNFNEFMLYVELGESEASEDFFLDVILKFLKEMLTKENSSVTVFQQMVKTHFGNVVEKSKDALKHAETSCKGCAKEYVRFFKDYMNVKSENDFRINNVDGFTEAVLQKLDNLYAEFLSQANSSFGTLLNEDNKAAIRPLFEKIMGCREKCPFCAAPCSQSLELHAGDHRANQHYPTGVSGTVVVWGLFSNTQETYDASEERCRKRGKLSLDTCQTMVGTRADIRTMLTVQKYNKWFHMLFNLNYHSFKTYKEIAEYENWDIPHCQDHKTSLYWKWFMAQFDKELAEHYKASRPEIPEAWIEVTWEEAKESLDEPDLFPV